MNFLNDFVSRWDSHSYLFIATHGYVTKGDEAPFIVFPPFYPFLIKVVNYFLGNPALSAFLISTVSLILGLFVFYKLLILDYKKKQSRWIVIILAIFPTSYFFLIAYPESLFLLLTVSSFYFARKNKFKLSALTASLATLTRPFGILIWPVLLIEWAREKKRNWADLPLILSFLALSVTIYLSLNYSLFGNPLAFQVFLKNHWQKTFTYPWSGIINSWLRGINTPSRNPEYKYIVGCAEAIASTLAWLFIALNIIFKKIRMRLSYLIYFILATILMTSTGFLLSTPRYLLSIPPFFITLGLLTSPKLLKFLWLLISLALLTYFISLFIKGHWAF